jgi:hypothetical protein
MGSIIEKNQRSTISCYCTFKEEKKKKKREAWWLYGSMTDCCPAVLGSNPVSPQHTADCKSLGGLPSGMVLGYGLTSVRGDRGEYYKK